jgi:2,3-dihydroxybenzoate decarboxylase
LVDFPAIYTGYPDLIGPIWAWGSDTSAHALRMIFSGLFKRFPKLKIILGHMGEALPYFFWRLDSRWRHYLGEEVPQEDLPSEIIKRHFTITTSGVCDPLALTVALTLMGNDKVMFSVDYPYEDTQLASSFIETAPISEEVRAKVCYGNAERILKIHVPIQNNG